MKRILAILSFVLILCGCEKIFTPSSITMAPMEIRMVKTNIQPVTMYIADFEGNGTDSADFDEESQTYTIKCQWLTASIALSSYDAKDSTYELILKADLYSDGDERTLYVGGMNKDYHDSMEVTLR